MRTTLLLKPFVTMKRLIFAFFFFTATLTHAQQWIWMGGENTPGARAGAATWQDNEGNFWLKGGRGAADSNEGLLNYLWKYDYSKKQWTLMGGNKSPNNTGKYDATPFPGARENAASWTDRQGNHWLFGGRGFGKTNEVGLLNDLWKYSVQT
jgi:N-acetylneuraminic acid mutarotase